MAETLQTVKIMIQCSTYEHLMKALDDIKDVAESFKEVICDSGLKYSDIDRDGIAISLDTESLESRP